MEEEDERFSHIKNDPRFRPIPKRERKVEIDKRFASMFHDKKFKVQYLMDKRGRPLQRSTAEDLKKYYEVHSSSSESDNEASENETEDAEHRGHVKPVPEEREFSVKVVKNKKAVSAKSTSSSDSGNDSHNQSEPEVDLARGEGNVESSSSDSGSDEEAEESGIEHKWGELETGVTRAENITHRLAVCNMDWDRIIAQDLFVLLSNFKPAEGTIKSVMVYPSEYGMERMKEEAIRGPPELTEITLASDEEDYTETKEGSKYHMETLRKYQLNRLRYYYAVVDCDSVETANALYTELDGMEYESSASQLDLRFIPDDVTFDQEPSSTADKLPDMTSYQPILFTTKALQQTMVELTWDETNPNRVRTFERAFNPEDQNNDDLRTYLASSSSSEAEDEAEIEKTEKEDENQNSKSVKSRIAKYKDLLASIENEEEKKKNKDIEMEITWEPGLKDKAESLLKMKQQKEEMTCFEEFLQKKREKKKEQRKGKKEVDKNEENKDEDLCEDDELPFDVDMSDLFFKEETNIKEEKLNKKMKIKKKEQDDKSDDKSKNELELLVMEDDDGGKEHFNLKNLVEEATMSKRKKRKLDKMKKKGMKEKKEDNFQINTKDSRFSALFSSSDFNIDPSDTHFKKTKAMEVLLQEKQKRRKIEPVHQNSKMEDSKKLDPMLTSLVKSVKNKTSNFKKH